MDKSLVVKRKSPRSINSNVYLEHFPAKLRSPILFETHVLSIPLQIIITYYKNNITLPSLLSIKWRKVYMYKKCILR